MNELIERMAAAMVARLRPAHSGGNLRLIDVDETEVDFIELAELALAEVLKGSEACSVCGSVVIPENLPPENLPNVSRASHYS